MILNYCSYFRTLLATVALLLCGSAWAASPLDVPGKITITPLPGQVMFGNGGASVIDHGGHQYAATGVGAGNSVTCIGVPLGSDPGLTPPGNLSPQPLTLLPDRTGVVVTFRSAVGDLHVYSYTCGSGGKLLATVAAGQYPLASTAFWVATAMAPNGDLHLIDQNGNVLQIDTQAGTAAKAIVRFTPADFSALAVFPDGAQSDPFRQISANFAPDGTLFLLLTQKIAQGQPHAGQLGHWLLTAKTSEKMKIRLGPMLAMGSHQQITGDGTLLGGVVQTPAIVQYAPQLQAMIVGPVAGLDWHRDTVGQQFGDDTGSWQGFGVRVVPIDEKIPGASGYFSLDMAFRPLYDCDPFSSDTSCLQELMEAFYVGENDKLEFIFNWDVSGPPQTLRHRIDFDPTALDLDEDGLSAGEEAAAGTSDFLPDSDGGGTRDDLEKRLGTDPTKPGDDGVKQPASGPFFAPSPLIRMLTDAWEAQVKAGAQVKAADVLRPWCDRTTKHCFGPNGEYVADLNALGGTFLYNQGYSVDGKFFTLVTTKGIDTYHFATGERKTIAGPLDLAPLGITMVGAPPQVLGVDDSRVYVSASLPPAGAHVIGVIKPTGTSLLLDESAINATRKAQKLDEFMFEVDSQSAWNPLRRELTVTAENLVNFLLLGLGDDGTLTYFDSPRSIAGLTGPIGSQISHGLPQLRANPMDTGHELIRSQGVGLAYDGTHLGIYVGVFGDNFTVDSHRLWNDSLQYTSTSGSYVGEYELVRTLTPNQPGDVLVVGSQQMAPDGSPFVGSWMATSGPRGGMLPLTGILGQAAQPTSPNTVQSVAGLDLSADGHACIADSVAGNLLWLGPDPQNFDAPTDLQWTQSVSGIVDCKVTADGHIHALAGGPPRVEEHEPAAGKLLKTTPVTANGPLLSFFVEPDGSYHVVDGTGKVWGALRLADGRLLESVDGDLEVNGTTTGLTIDALYGKLQVGMLPFDANLLKVTPLHMVERPDHTVVLMAHRMPQSLGTISAFPIVLDLATHRFGQLFVETIIPGAKPSGLAIRPGATWTDPWGNERKPGSTVTPDQDAGSTGTGVDASSSGSNPDADDAGSRTASGCSAGARTSAWSSLLAALVCAVRLRRSRHGARSPANLV